MKWAKIPTEFLYLPDKEVVAIAKYVMLYGILERAPTPSECLRNMSAKQWETVQKHLRTLSEQISSDINITQYNRNRKKAKNEKNQTDTKKSTTESTTENTTEVPTESTRTDKRDKREEREYIKKQAKKILPVHQAIVNYLADSLSICLNRKISSRGWTDEIRKLCELDKVSPERVMDALRWHFSHLDREYCLEIQSAKALREKFSRLEAQMKRAESTEDKPFYL